METRSFRKSFFVVIMLLSMTLLFALFGCGDIYKNIKITTETTEVSLWLNSDDEQKPTSRVVTVNLTGVGDKNISNSLVVVFEGNRNIATATKPVFGANGQATFNVVARAPGEATMFVKLADNTNVSSEGIKVEVTEPVKALSVTSTNVMVARGKSVNLLTSGKINFLPVTTTENDVEFFFPTSGQSGGVKKDETRGLEIDGGILKATSNAGLGLVTIVAKSTALANFDETSPLQKSFKVLVCDDIDEEGIFVEEIAGDGSTEIVEELTLVENYRTDAENFNQKRVLVSVLNTKDQRVDEFLSYSIEAIRTEDVSSISALGIVDVSHNYDDFARVIDDQFIVTAQSSGSTTYYIKVCIVDENGNVYKTFLKPLDITVKTIATSIYAKTKDGTDDVVHEFDISQTLGDLEIKVFDENSYVEKDMPGTWVNLTTSQSNDTSLKITLDSIKLFVNDVLVEYTAEDEEILNYASNIKLFDSKKSKIYFNELFERGKDVFVAFDESAFAANESLAGFKLKVWANNNDERFLFSATIDCSVSMSFGHLEIVGEKLAKVGQVLAFEVSSAVGNVDLSFFDFLMTPGIVSEPQILGNAFRVTALKVGQVSIVLQEKYSLVRSVVVVEVVVPTEFVWIVSENQDGIAQIINKEESISDEIREHALEKLVVGVEDANLGIYAYIKTSEKDASIKSVDYEILSDTGVVSAILTSFTTINFVIKQTDNEETVRMNITYYKVNEEGKVVEDVFSQEIKIEAFIPISVFAWDALGTTDLEIDLYDTEELSLKNQQTQNVGYALLKPFVSNPRSSREYDWMPSESSGNIKIVKTIEDRQVYGTSMGGYVVGGDDDVSEDDDIFTIRLQEDGLFVSAKIGQDTTNSNSGLLRGMVRIQIAVNEFGHYRSVSAVLKFYAPENKIDSLSYDNNEIYLEAYNQDVETNRNGNYGQAKLDVRPSSKNVFDKGLTYVVCDEDENIFYIFDDQLGCVYESANYPIFVKLDEDEVAFACVNQSFSGFESSYFVKVFPSEVLNVVYNALNLNVWKQKFESTKSQLVQVVLHDGKTKEHAYKIFDEADFLTISKNTSSHFEIEQDIELFGTEKFESMEEFSGSLFSAEGFRWKIFGFAPTNGYFTKTLTDDGEISNVEFVYSNIKVFANEFGVVAVSNQGTIKNVRLNALNDSIIEVDVENADEAVVVGGFVGYNSKDILDVGGVVNLKVVVDSLSALKPFYVGGVAGELHNSGKVTFSNECNLIVNIDAVSGFYIDSSAVGGVAGYVNQGQIAGVAKFVTQDGHQKQVQGMLNLDAIINAPKLDNVGGIAGICEIVGAVQFVTVVPNIVANNNVGGAFGKVTNSQNQDNSSIKRIFVEFYGESENKAGIVANNNVGGFVGVLEKNSQIIESYVLSYVDLQIQKFGSAIDESTQFYGDIVARDNVGGFVGFMSNSTIHSCFARVKINLDSTEAKPVVGGFVGKFVSDADGGLTQTIFAAFSIGDVFVFDENIDFSDEFKIGGFAGSAETSNGASFSECYTIMANGKGIFVNPQFDLEGEIVSESLQNFVGYSNYDFIANNECYFAIDSNENVPNNFGAKAKPVNDLKLQNFLAYIRNNWSNEYWVQSLPESSLNDDFPVLVVFNNGIAEYLYGHQMTSISISSLGMGVKPVVRNIDGSTVEAIFPTFWTFDSASNKMIVSLDSLALFGKSRIDDDMNSFAKLLLSAELIGLDTLTENDMMRVRTDNNDRKVVVTSSNPNVVSVSDPSTFELEFHSVGYSTITIASRKNSTIKASFEICVIGGFLDFDMYYYTNSGNNEATAVDIENRIIEKDIELLPEENLIGTFVVADRSSISSATLNAFVSETFDRDPTNNDVVFVNVQNDEATTFKYVFSNSGWGFSVISTLEIANYSPANINTVLSNHINSVAGRAARVNDVVFANIIKEGNLDVVYKFTYKKMGWENSKILKISSGGAVYLYTDFVQASSTMYGDNFALIYDFEDSKIEILDTDGNMGYLNNPYQIIKAKPSESEVECGRIIATLAIKVQFSDTVTYVPLNMTQTNLNPALSIQKAFTPYIFKGVSGLSLSENVGEISNSETFSVNLTIKTDAIKEVLQSIENRFNNPKNPMTMSFDNEEDLYYVDASTLTELRNCVNGDAFRTVEGILKFYNSSRTEKVVRFVCTPNEDTNQILLQLEFFYDQVRLSNTVVQTVRIVATNDDGSTKEANLTINWKPTTITTLELLHYEDKSDYKLNYGKEQASTQIGSGKLGLLKISIIQPYADYDYIVISSDANNPYKISFAHYVYEATVDGIGDLKYSDEYSRTNTEDGSIEIYNNPAVILNSVFYVSTLTEVGIPEGTYLKINVVAYKKDSQTGQISVAGTRSLVLLSVFAPFVQLSLQSDFGNFVARGTESVIVASGIAENSIIKFRVDGVSGSDILSSVVLFEQATNVTKENPTYTNQTGNVTFNLNLYVGILAQATDGTIDVVGTVYSSSMQQITEYRLTLYVVDFLIKSIGVEGISQSGNTLEARIQDGYTALKLNVTTDFGLFNAENANKSSINQKAMDLFKKYFQSTYKDYELEFYQAFAALKTNISSYVKDLNAIGSSAGDSIWEYANKRMNKNNSYENFFIDTKTDSNTDEAFTVVRGKVQTTDSNFGVAVARGYTLAGDYYASMLDIDWGAGILIESIYLYEYQFNINFVNSSTEVSPDPIYSAAQLREMVEGGHYILMNDIYLSNWTPLSTKIGSLDGNGFVITLQNFDIKTKTDSGAFVQSIDVGLFTTLSTYQDSTTNENKPSKLLNIILDVSRTVVTDLRGIKTVNFGFLVAQNNGGIIYNCEVISTYRESQENESAYSDYDPISQNPPINNDYANYYNSQANWLRYIQTDAQISKVVDQKEGVLKNSYPYANTIFTSWFDMGSTNEAHIYTRNIVSTFILVSPTVDGANVDANVGGLVGFNGQNSFISNSRVGRIGNIRTLGNRTLDAQVGLNIFGGGRFGGFVGQNDGTIAASYFANGNVVNLFNTTTDSSMVGGFVGFNNYNGKINTSYVESAKHEILLDGDNNFVIDRDVFHYDHEEFKIIDKNLNEKAVVDRDQLVFVLDNVEYYIVDKQIKYARATENKIYSTGSAAGFVNQNEGEIENCFSNIEIVSSLGVGGFVYSNNTSGSVIEDCYTASLLNSSSSMNGQFVGVDATLDVLNSGTVENCFYLIDDVLNNDAVIKESLADPATAVERKDLRGGENSKLWGFVFQNSADGDGVWNSDSEDEFNLPSLVQANLTAFSNRVIDGQNPDESYNYSYTLFGPGTINNPRIVYSTSTFNEAFPRNEEAGVFVRFIADVDFAGGSPEFSYQNDFNGTIWGNGMNVKHYKILNGTREFLGLFSRIGSYDYTVVSNLVLTPDQISGTQRFAVGSLAGSAVNADINNIKIYAYDIDSKINGFNATGGLVGIFKNTTGTRSRVENIKSSITVVSTFSPSTTGNLEFYKQVDNAEVQDVNTNISYAGGVIGIVDYDLGTFESGEKEPAVVNCSTLGNVTIGAEIVGGVFGFVSNTSTVSSSTFVLNTKSKNGQSLQGGSFSGGIVGENRGLVEYSYVALSGTEQQTSDERFVATGRAEDQQATEILFEESNFVVGGIVGLNVGHTQDGTQSKTGRIAYVYNRGNVVSTNAVVAGGVVGLSVSSIETIETKAALNAVVNVATIATPINRYEYVDISEEGQEPKFVLRNEKQGEESDQISVSLYLSNIYTTAKVGAGTTTGGLVGIATGIVNTQGANSIVVLPSSFGSQNTDENAAVFEGALFGKILYSSRMTDESSKEFYIVFSDGFAPADSTIVTFNEDVLHTNKHKHFVGNYTVRTVGDNYDSIIYQACFGDVQSQEPFDELSDIAVSLENMNLVFNAFNEQQWRLDRTWTNIIFPRLVTGRIVSVQPITTEEDFLTYIKGGRIGNFVVTDDLVFDLSNQDYLLAFQQLSSEDKPVSGTIRGENLNNPHKNVTIKFLNNSGSIPLFGYIKSLSLENIDFVFDDEVVLKNLNNDYFGLLAYTSQSCRFTNIKISTASDDKVAIKKHKPAGDEMGYGDSYKAIGGLVGKSQNDYYTQIVSKVLIESIDVTPKDEVLQVGGIAGYADHMAISKSNVFIKTGIKTNAKANVYVGGYAGYVGGHVAVNMSSASTGKVEIEQIDDTNCLKIENANSTLFVGGVFGHAECSTATSKINNMTIEQFLFGVFCMGESFVGGVVGKAESVGFENNKVKSMQISNNTTLAMNIGTTTTHIGGIAGFANSKVILATNGELQATNKLENCFANVLFNINDHEGKDNILFVGGLVGEYAVKQQTTTKKGSNNYELFKLNYTTGTINILGKDVPVISGPLDYPSNKLYAAGMIGKLSGSVAASDYSETELLNAAFSFGKSANDVNVFVNNHHHEVYAGGIAGFSNVALSNCFNYGTISNNDQEDSVDGQAFSYVGGIVGKATSTLFAAHSFGAVFGANQMFARPLGEDTTTWIERNNVGAIVGLSTAAQALSGAEYCLDLVGVLQENHLTSTLQKLSLDDVFKFEDGEIVYRTVEDNTLHLPYFAVFEDFVKNYSSNVFATMASTEQQLKDALNDDTNPYKTIILDKDEISQACLNVGGNINIKNVSRIVGLGTILKTSAAIFVEVPKNTLISGIVVTADLLETANASFGALTVTNNGSIVNCVAGMLPSTIESSDTIAANSNMLDQETFENLTAKLNIRISGSNVNVGSLVGFNNNLVLGCWSYADIEILEGTSGYVGGLVGNNCGSTSYGYSMGRIVNLTNSADFYLGGVVGHCAQNAKLKQLGAFVDISSKTNYGASVGEIVLSAGDDRPHSTVVSAIVAVTDLSKLDDEASGKGDRDSKFVLSKGYADRKKLFGSDQLNSNFFSIDTGANDLNLNYGLPFLNLGTSAIQNYKNSTSEMQDIRFTGDGLNTPYEVENFTTLKRIQEKAYSSRKFALTRDIVAHSQISSSASGTMFSLDGNYKTIFIDQLTDGYVDGTGNKVSTNNFTLFNLVLWEGKIERLKLKINETSEVKPSSNAVVAPLLKTIAQNGGQAKIENCAVFGNIKITGNGSGTVGGLVGNFNGGEISQCWTDVRFELDGISSKNSYKLGGLVGSLGTNTTIDQSFASGPIVVNNSKNVVVGGLVGIVNINTKTTKTTPVTISSSYFSGVTKHQPEISQISFDDQSSGVFGALAGKLGGNTASNHYDILTANNKTNEVFNVKDFFFAGQLPKFETDLDSNMFTNVLFGYVFEAEYVTRQPVQGHYEPGFWKYNGGLTFNGKMFENVYVLCPSSLNDSSSSSPDLYYKVVVTNSTYNGISGISFNNSTEISMEGFKKFAGYKPYLESTTPQDRQEDSFNFE